MMFLSGNIEQDLELLLGKYNGLVFVFKNESYKNYFRNIKYLNNNDDIEYEIIKSSLFEVSLIYKGQLFEDVKMAHMFARNFISVLEYVREYKIPYSLHGYHSACFSPLFINDNFEIVDYGKSQKIIVIDKEYDYIDDGISFIMSAKWLKKIIVLPQEYKEYNNANLDKNTQVYYFKNNEELKSLLKTKIYYVALVFSIDFNIQSLKNTIIQHSLFNI